MRKLDMIEEKFSEGVGMFMKLLKMGIVTGIATVGLVVLPLTTASAASAPQGFKLQTVLVAGNGNGKHQKPHSTPETPYAAIFPLVIAGATWFVYRKRRQQQA